jgi:hypothetical protein
MYIGKPSKSNAAISYYSLQDGLWSNMSNVWSTDGVNPCGCNPGSDVSDNIIINHNINMNSDVSVISGGSIYVSSGNSLLSANYNLVIDNGSITAYGLVDVSEIEIYSLGTGNFYGPVTAENKFIVEGNALFDSLLTVTNASLIFQSSAYFTAQHGWRINLPNGNIYNHGTINFLGTCLIINNGNFYNESTAIVSGAGYVETENGNIYNNGSWAILVDWCASGQGYNMPTLPNCASPWCSNGIPLPISLLYFNGSIDKDVVTLNWGTGAEVNNKEFILERARNSNNYNQIATIPGAGNSSNINEYTYTDKNVPQGIWLYRLSQIDYNGEVSTYSPTIVEIGRHTAKKPIMVNPNPFHEEAVIQFYSDKNQNIVMQVFNTSGIVVHSDHFHANKGDNTYKFRTPNNLNKGMYFFRLANENIIIGEESALYSF